MSIANEIPFDRLLDCRGLRCPHPIVNMAREMRIIEEGETIKLIADDLACPSDINAWVKYSNNELLRLKSDDNEIIAFIRKSIKNFK
ncbi:MAG TPA: sulfurtransferase TusA family protein [Spirochaetes bacterium]|nr:sulfurtransferase TusA family protein [Spirochaetota bacterium]